MVTQSKAYTCPMHPEVKQNSPGTCPKCGMKLVSASGKSRHSVKES
jgi:Cu+-exporting ATPase